MDTNKNRSYLEIDKSSAYYIKVIFYMFLKINERFFSKLYQ